MSADGHDVQSSMESGRATPRRRTNWGIAWYSSYMAPSLLYVEVVLTHRITRTRRVRAFIALTKPRIIELLLFTTVPTMIVAESGLPSVWLIVATVIGGTLAAGGANAINMYIDRDIDKLMERTKKRPLVTGEVGPSEALAFAVLLEIGAFLLLWIAVNLLSAVLAIAATLFYVFVYSIWLKRSSSSNIVIGGAAGAAPVLIGWSAVTNSLAWAPVILFALVFFWTPPHFWALAIKYKEDYSAADVPMLPSIVNIRETAIRMLCYTVVSVAFSFVFAGVGGMGTIYLIGAIVLGSVFLLLSFKVLRVQDVRSAMQLFAYSITYLTLLFGVMALDELTRSGL